MGGERERLFEVCQDVLSRDHRRLGEQQLPYKMGRLSCALAWAFALAVQHQTLHVDFLCEPVGLSEFFTRIWIRRLPSFKAFVCRSAGPVGFGAMWQWRRLGKRALVTWTD